MGDAGAADGTEPFAYPEVGPGWQTYTMITNFEGDVTDLAENFMDVPHTAFVHSGWFRKASSHDPKRAEAVVERTANSVLVEYFQKDDTIGFSKKLVNPDNQPMTHTDKFYMPNCTRVDYMWGERRGFVITSQVTPVTPERAIVYTAITFRFGIFNPLARVLLPWYTRVVINQDVDIMEVQTRNLARFGRRRFNSTEADVIHRSIESLREHALNGSEGPPPEPLTTRIAFWM
jgi:phenylpropionate dioxygenase-like ring-hydroxylating dioxygenase large terminal subunit